MEQAQEIEPKPQTLADRVASARARASSLKKGKIKRIFIFLILAIGITVIGFQFRSLSEPAAEDATLRDKYPQLIGIYTTDPYANVQATTEITWEGNSAHERLLLNVSGTGVEPSTGIVITSSLPADKGEQIGDHIYRPTLYHSGFQPNSTEKVMVYTAYFTVQELSALHEPLGQGSIVGFFNLPRVAQITKGTFFARLPALGYNESLPLSNPYLMAERVPGMKPNTDDFVLLPQQKNPIYTGINEDPSAYNSFPGSSGQKLYWEPSILSSTEILYDVYNQISGYQVESNSPVSGHLQDYNYVWTSTGSLNPTLTATSTDSLDAEDRWNFYSGVVFGIAAAAGIAVIQELPPDIPLLPIQLSRGLKSKRKTDRSGPEDRTEKPGVEATPEEAVAAGSGEPMREPVPEEPPESPQP
jgi:hypothetical protein